MKIAKGLLGQKKETPELSILLCFIWKSCILWEGSGNEKEDGRTTWEKKRKKKKEFFSAKNFAT